MTWLEELQYSAVIKPSRQKPIRRRFVGVRDAKAQLSRLLQEGQDGEEWTITERVKPVARRVPIARGTMSFAQRLARLEENGTIEPAHADALSLPPPVPLQSGLAQKILERDRVRSREADRRSGNVLGYVGRSLCALSDAHSAANFSARSQRRISLRHVP